MIGIYKITNPLNEVYIGQSIDIDIRIYNHSKKSSNKLLRESIEKHGWSNHKIEILCECEESELNQKETEYIKKYLIKGNVFNNHLHGTNGGRKKLTNERFQVRCHPKVIKDVRNYAKQRSEEYLSKTESENINTKKPCCTYQTKK